MTTRRVLIALPVALAAWVGVLAVVLRLGGPAPEALVVLPPLHLVRALPPGVAITDRNALGLVARGDGDLVPALYRAGAWLVLPAGLRGCLGL